MSDQAQLRLVEERRDAIRKWLDDEAPFTVADQKHLDAHSPEQAYYHFGYQAACTDIIDLLTGARRVSSVEDDCA